jgi:hypothetical protein
LNEGIDQVYCGLAAFAVKKTDGSVITWGYQEYGGDSSYVANDLVNVAHISGNRLYHCGSSAA